MQKNNETLLIRDQISTLLKKIHNNKKEHEKLDDKIKMVRAKIDNWDNNKYYDK